MSRNTIAAIAVGLLSLWSTNRLNAQWTQVKELPGKRVSALASSGTTICAIADNRLFTSTDGGTTWNPISVGSPYPLTGLTYAVDQKAFFVGTPIEIFRSTDEGASWKELGHGQAGGAYLAVLGNTVVLGGGLVGVQRSTDCGESWAHPIAGAPANYNLTSFAAGSGAFLAGSEEGGVVYRSLDGGATWAKLGGIGPDNDGIFNVAILQGTFFAASSGSGMSRSTDGGVTWISSSRGLVGSYDHPLNYHPMNAFAESGTRFYAGSANGVFLSVDSGGTWTSVNRGLGDPEVLSLAVVGSTLLAGTEIGGLWRAPLSDIVASAPDESREAPETSTLFQNYPNPFNPRTMISFRLSAASDIRLTVYDMLGKEVAILINERKSPGSYEVPFDASGLSSGVYVCRLTAEQFVQARKMTVVR